MCGHVGIAGNLEHKDEGTFKRLLIFDYFRGPDSTGVAVLRNNKDSHVVKMATHPIDLFDSNRFKSAISGYQSQVFLGHNRLATQGKVNGLNAHPFQFDHIIGAHNGTLDRKSWDRLDEASGIKTDVDSAAIFACMAKIGVEATIELMEEGTTSQSGAWALVWINLQDNSLNFLRNKHRPFWTAFSDDFKKVLWASEWPMIAGATRMSPSEYKIHVDEEGHGYWETDVDTWYRYDLDELKKGSAKRPDVAVKEVKGREPEPVRYTAGRSAPFVLGKPAQNGGKTPSTTTLGQECTDDHSSCPSNLELVGTVFTPWGSFIEKYDFDQLAKYGCTLCGGEVKYTDIGSTLLHETDQIICKTCTGNTDHNRIYATEGEIKKFIRELNYSDLSGEVRCS